MYRVQGFITGEHIITNQSIIVSFRLPLVCYLC